MKDNSINKPSDVDKEILSHYICKNPQEVERLLNEIKERKLFKHKEYNSRIKSRYRNIQKNQVIENDLMDELSSKMEGIYIELM